jgi:hypothetical protein
VGTGLDGLVGFGGVVGFGIGELVGIGGVGGLVVDVRVWVGTETVSVGSWSGLQASTRETMTIVVPKRIIQVFISSLLFCVPCIHNLFLVVYSGSFSILKAGGFGPL